MLASLRGGRDAAIKRKLLANLSECVKDIQYQSQVAREYASTVGAGDSTTSLCEALEAIFLHGLNNTLLRRARNAFVDPAQRPQMHFWPLVLLVSHRQSVEQISMLTQITSQVGQCRAWLRAALNDCLLSSYLAALLRNAGAVAPFYTRGAFCRDTEALELARQLLEGLESCVQFDVPLNSSLLNEWADGALVAAGAWVPPARPEPVTAGLDVASMLRDEPASPPPPIVSGTSLLDEDQALKLILSEREEIETLSPRQRAADAVSEPVTEAVAKDEVGTGSVGPPPPPVPAEPLTPPADDIDLLDYELTSRDYVATPPPPSPTHARVSSPDTDSLSALAGDDEPSDLRRMMRGINEQLRLEPEEEEPVPAPPAPEPSTPDDPVLRQLGFELVPDERSAFDEPEWRRLCAQLGRLARERGLDHQNYQCAGCGDPLGGGAARACAFTGDYCCAACTSADAFLVPARVIHNWDFRRYAVSRRAAIFLLEVQQRPLLDVRRLNARAYAGVADMRLLRDLRVQLNLLRAYVATCRERERLTAALRRMLYPRDYLYEAVHTYAPADLAQILSGSLAAALRRVVAFAREHVLACWLCSQKGFICEVCRAPDPLYPFDVGVVHRCERCAGVFHDDCVRRQPCPKCERLSRRRLHTAI